MAITSRYFTEFDRFGADYVQESEDRPIMATVCDNNVAQRILFSAIFSKIAERECVKER